MFDAEFIGWQSESEDNDSEKIPLFNIIRPFRSDTGSTITLETCLKKGLSFDKKYMDYHEHDFSYKYNDDILMCVCGEEQEFDPNDLDEPAYGSEKE